VDPGGAPRPGPNSDEGAIPEYPSVGGPSTEGRDGPHVLLTNAISAHHFDDAYALGYRGQGVRVAVVDQGVDFGHPDLAGTQATVTDPSSPYFGWPIAYDPKSLTAYLKTGSPDGTLFANTTTTGTGPFEVTHTIKVDGTNDFGDREKWASDPRDNTAAGAGGDKLDFDLTDLYATRDAQNWYFGFPVYLQAQNASFTLLIDVNNETSGAYVAPRSSVDTNASASDRLNDVRWSPDGTKVATVSGDRLVRIWDASGRVLLTMGPHAGEPMSVAWSPDGTKVASADKDHLRLWDAATGALLRDIQYVPFGDPTITENGILAFSPNGTWVAAGTFKFVHVFDVATGAKFGDVWPANADVNAVAFNAAGDRLAVGLGDNSVRVYAVGPAIFNTPVPATALYTLAGPSGHTQPVLAIAWSPDGTKIVSGARDNTAKLWDVASQTVLQTMPDQQSWVLAAAWAPNGLQFVTGSQGLSPSVAPSFAIWDSAGTLQRLVPQGRAVRGIDWSVLGTVVTGGEDLTARLWTSGGNPIRVLVAHRPDFALYVHGFSRYSDRENKYVHGTELATWYAWNVAAGAWDAIALLNASGQQAALQVGAGLFNEFSVPRTLLGDPPAISLSLFSSGENVSRAQDTVPSDRNVDFKGVDFTPGWSSVSAWAWQRIEEYRIAGLTSRSGVFHFGFHPAPSVQRTFGALGILVADGAAAGVYDRVYLDMNDDHVFDASDVVVTKASPIAAIDVRDVVGNPVPDGYADISAGMMYFLADGSHAIPYSDRLAARKQADGLQVRIPGAGNLVAFAGEFGVDPITATRSEHGTRVASAIVAQGRILSGTADGARLVAIENGLSDPVEAWTFAVEGYDGVPQTSDDAQVVVSAFNFPTLHNDGWDSFSRTADFLSTQVSGTATFVASAGDYGYGYGTVASPASAPSVIAAGRAADFSLSSSLYGGGEGPSPHFHDAAVAGSRGPTAQGIVKPELLAVDTATVDIPLHSASDGSSATSSTPMVGSDFSAGIVAGAVAIVDQAFADRHGRRPTVQEVRTILMSGADDTYGDVLTQGAGFLNVSRSVKLALQTADAGLEVSPSVWQPGAYRGTARGAFTNLLFPGDTDAHSLVLTNDGASTLTANLQAVSYTKVGQYVHTNGTHKDVYEPGGDIALWVNDTGLWKVDGATLTAVRVAPPIPGMWSNADLVKVTAYSDLSRLVAKVGTNFQVNYSYQLRTYDWTINWAHWSGFGPFPAPAFFTDELNTIGETARDANVLEVRAAFALHEIHEGLVISLEDAGTPTYIDALPWTFVVEFYQRVPFPWIALSETSLSVPAGGSHTVTASVTVPGGAGFGSYEASILVRDVTHGTTTTVPVLANVGARGPSLTFGGNLLSADLYDNNRLFGGYDRAIPGLTGTRLTRPTLGDWRYFFFEIPDQGLYGNPLGYKLLIQTSWPAAPSDVDTFAFGRTSADLSSQWNSSYYGPFTLKQLAKSEELDKPEFRTATGGPEEFVAYDLVSGLNVIALHAFSLRGAEVDVRLAGRAGWINAPSAVDVATRSYAGRAPFAFLSNMDLPGLRASAVGPAQTTAFASVEAHQDVQSWWNFPAWGEWMYRASFTYIFHVEKALILDVHIEGLADVNDLDLGVFRNTAGAPCEWDPALPDPLTGVAGYWKGCGIDPEEYLVTDCTPAGGGLCIPAGPSTWGYNADGDADEEVKWVNPPDGEYMVQVLGFAVPSGLGHFDMQLSVTLDTGQGYQIAEAPKPAEIVNGTAGGLPAFTRVGLNMTWAFPTTQAEDAYGGAVLLGLPNAPGVVVVPAAVRLDRTAPAITGFRIQPFHGRLDRATNDTTSDGAPTIVVGATDYSLGQLDRNSARIWVDGEDLSTVEGVSVQYLTRGTKLGLWEGTITVTPPALPDGAHTVNVSIADRAGNVATASFAFAVDTTAPTLAVTPPLRRFTTSDTFAVSGSVDPGSSVNVRGQWYVVSSGTFSISVPLLNGTNDLAVTAVDWFDADASGNPLPGNSVTITQTVIRDLVAPTFQKFGTNLQATVTADATVMVSGQVDDYVSPVEHGAVGDLALSVNGASVAILADGTFRAVVPLTEGANPIDAVLVDGAGNRATRSTSVMRDSTAPALTLTTQPPATVTAPDVTIAGLTDSDALVTVNGLYVPSPGGAFTTNLTLSPGPNTIIVESRDLAGNVAEKTLTVTYQAPTSGPSWVLPAGLFGAGAVIGIVLALALHRGGIRIPGLSRRPGGTDDEGTAEEEAEEPQSESAEPPASEDGPAEGPRETRLKSAYEDGRITKDVYEENLRKIRGSGGA